jgi:3-phenylpropionate/cinnamic acid dioxygenase small subunit
MSTSINETLTQTLYYEALMLDEGRFEDWLNLLSPKLRYTVHIQQDTAVDWQDSASQRLVYMDEDYGSMQLRVLKIRTNLPQTEVPRSRTVRSISNVLVEEEVPGTYTVRSAFLLYRNHRQRDTELLAGHRTDTWATESGACRLQTRDVRFAANVLPTKSLSLFY